MKLRTFSLGIHSTALFAASVAASVAALFSANVAAAEQGYYRAPAIHQDHIIFTAEGDLWHRTADNTKRLTSHPAEEIGAAISHDGKLVAYAANYEGATEVYVIPITGGIPKRVSFENSRVRVQGWTPNGEVMFSTDNVVGPANQWVLRTVNPESLETATLPLVDAIEGTTNSNGQEVYFTRFGLQATGDNARVYRGGAMGEIWRFNLGSNQEATLLTENHQGSVKRPMYHEGRIYFISDADGTPNIWSMTTAGRDFRQHTDYDDWQVWSASHHNGKIVYQRGADLHEFDIESGDSHTLAINLTSDFKARQERWLENPLSYITAARFDNHDQVVITARSQIAVANTGPRRLVQITTPAESRSRNAFLSHDGEWVYALNDHTGENEIWRFPADGSEGAEQLTDNGSTFRWNLAPSPNGKWLAHDDKNGDLWLLNLESGENQRIQTGAVGHWGMADLVWNADSNLLAFSRTGQDNSRQKIWLYSLATEQTQVLTSNKYESGSPAFSRDGNWLYFLSDRNFQATPSSPWGDRNLGPMFNNRALIYAVALKPDACFPFAPPQEVVSCDNEVAKEQGVDLAGAPERLWQVPVPADNYYNLSANAERLYVQTRTFDRSAPPTLHSIAFSQTDVKAEVFASNVNNYELSHDGKRLFFQQNGNNNMFIVDANATAPGDLSKAAVNTNDWQLAFSPTEEWRQMFRDAWLMHRDFLFDSNMRGIDWVEMRERYEPLLDRLTDRHELDDVFSQLLSELNVLHSQVRGGEYSEPSERASAASLGGQFSMATNGLRIDTIYRVDADLPDQASPLSAPGVDAAVGDVITHINGRTVSHLGELITALRGQANKQVLLTIQRNGETLQTVVTPVSAGRDHRLRYETWVENNRDKVAEASDGKFGYLHLYAMGGNDIASFAREFYANYQKEGLIIDVRRNRGGNIDSWIIEKLLRRAWSFWQPRLGEGYTNMQQTFRGQLVVLTDQLTYSDGETFSAGVKALNLGPLVGKQTTGAGVWLSGRNSLADRGVARVAETPQYAMDGRWILEGFGVTPDIEVDNLPFATFNGSDAQLDRGIQVLRELLRENPYPQLEPQPMSAPRADDISR
ncbi:peptidase S41 [Aliidiomarina iranensis]|uniref:Tricorn protease homolog n=1 Tax=Aliidiomarina iranensis TaxID=1434071 RepID=A0A432VR57_9GAMM|nr:S41 family peptidase [Aliidiomarina iranensis]RUO18751.1 peptidase S41 [Aliidiomarina iranensis]